MYLKTQKLRQMNQPATTFIGNKIKHYHFTDYFLIHPTYILKRLQKLLRVQSSSEFFSIFFQLLFCLLAHVVCHVMSQQPFFTDETKWKKIAISKRKFTQKGCHKQCKKQYLQVLALSLCMQHTSSHTAVHIYTLLWLCQWKMHGQLKGHGLLPVS